MVTVFRYLLFALAPLFLSACVTIRYLPIETMQPSKFTFEGPKKNIAIIAPHTLLLDAVVSNEGTKSVPTDSLIYNILFTLKNSWEKALGYENTNFFIKIMNDGDQLALPSEFDLIVHLETLQIKNNYYGQQYTFPLVWEAYLYVRYLAKWTIRNKSGTLIDDHTDTFLIDWSSGFNDTKGDAVDNLPSVNDAWWDLGIIIAQRYYTRILPQWQKETRSVYMVDKFPDLSQSAYTAMQNDSYVRAFNIWENMLLSCRKKGQKKRKSQITHNLAVSCEYQNQLEQAIYWAKQSTNLKQKKRTVNYLNLLQKRELDRVKLDVQTSQ